MTSFVNQCQSYLENNPARFVSLIMVITMEESNLYFFFGIIPYRYNAEKRIYILNRAEKYLNLLVKCCVPNLTLVILGICHPEIVAVDASLANVIYGTQMILNVAAFYLNIFESYRNDEYYKNLHQFCSLSNRQSKNSYNRVAIIKIAILTVFYGYYGVSMVLYVFSLGMFSIPELCFYCTYNYIEFASIVNMLYVASLFRTVRNYLEDLRLTVVKQHPTKARRKHSNYIKQKSGLINELNLRVSFSMGNIYLAASSMFYTAIYRLDRMEFCQSWPICNETAFYFGSCLAQLLGVGSFCYEVQQCINEVR